MGRKVCLQYIQKPHLEEPPIGCDQELKFPTFKQTTVIDQSPALFGFFHLHFGKKVNIMPRILVNSIDLTFTVPKNLFKKIKENVSSSRLISEVKTHPRARYQIIPILIGDGPVNNFEVECYQGLLHDLREDSWELFTLPGSDCNKKLDLKLEQKLIKLLTIKLKLPVKVFYQNIRFRPGPGTEADLWWASYLIYLKIKEVERYRETRAARALSDVIEGSSEYKGFIEHFKNYLHDL